MAGYSEKYFQKDTEFYSPMLNHGVHLVFVVIWVLYSPQRGVVTTKQTVDQATVKCKLISQMQDYQSKQ
jgi:hypothetical protein